MAFAGAASGAGFGGATDTSGFVGDIPESVGFAQMERHKQQERSDTRKKIIDNMMKKIKKEEVEILDEDVQDGLDQFADDFLERIGADELDHSSQDRIAQLMTKSMMLDNLEHLNNSYDQEFVANSVLKYGINPFDEGDVQEGTSVAEYKKILGDKIQAEFNNMFDAIGKVFNGLNMEGQGVFDDMEAYTDVVRAIMDDDPKYLTRAIEEKLGLEFDEYGNFDLSSTLKDNLSPIVGRYMSNLVIKPLVRKLQRYAGSVLGVEVEEGLLAAELAESQSLKQSSGIIAETMANFMGEGLGTETAAEFAALGAEGFAPLFVATGILEGTGALGELGATLLGSVNMQHRAYTESNHRWFGDGQEWLKYTGPVYTALKGIADLNMEVRDYMDWQAGTTTYQQYMEDKLQHDITHSAFQEAMEHIAREEGLSFDKTMSLANSVPLQGSDTWKRVLDTIMPKDVQRGIGSLPFVGGLLRTFLDGSSERSPKTRKDYMDYANSMQSYFQDLVDGVVDMDYSFDLVAGDGMKLGEYVAQQQAGSQEDQLAMLEDMRGQVDSSINDIRDMESYWDGEIQRIGRVMQRKRDFGFYLGKLGKEDEEADNEVLRKARASKQQMIEMESNMELQYSVLGNEVNDQKKLLEATGVEAKSEGELRAMYDRAKRDYESGGETVYNLRARLYGELVKQGMNAAEARRRAFDYVGKDFLLSHFGLTEADLHKTYMSYDDWLEDYNDGLQQWLETYYS